MEKLKNVTELLTVKNIFVVVLIIVGLIALVHGFVVDDETLKWISIIGGVILIVLPIVWLYMGDKLSQGKQRSDNQLSSRLSSRFDDF